MAEKTYIKDPSFKGKFRPGELVNEKGTNKIVIFQESDSLKYDFNTLYHRVIEKK